MKISKLVLSSAALALLSLPSIIDATSAEKASLTLSNEQNDAVIANPTEVLGNNEVPVVPDEHSPVPKRVHHDVFVPEAQWKEVPPGVAIPPGLDVRLDMSTGVRMARLLQPEDQLKTRKFKTTADGKVVPLDGVVDIPNNIAVPVASSHVALSSDGSPTVLNEDPTSKRRKSVESEEEEEDYVDPKLVSRANAMNIDVGSAKIADVLMSLPEPEPSIADALNRGLSGPELQELLRKVWARRQEELKNAMDSARTEAQLIQELLERLTAQDDKAPSVAQKLELLESLEEYVASVHNAEDFVRMGGLEAASLLLGSEHPPAVSARAAWLLGTAVKGAPELQVRANKAGTVGMVADFLHRQLEQLPTPSDDPTHRFSMNSEAVPPALESVQRAVYALNALSRYNHEGQRLAVQLGLPGHLQQLLASLAYLTQHSLGPVQHALHFQRRLEEAENRIAERGNAEGAPVLEEGHDQGLVEHINAMLTNLREVSGVSFPSSVEAEAFVRRLVVLSERSLQLLRNLQIDLDDQLKHPSHCAVEHLSIKLRSSEGPVLSKECEKVEFHGEPLLEEFVAPNNTYSQSICQSVRTMTDAIRGVSLVDPQVSNAQANIAEMTPHLHSLLCTLRAPEVI